MITGKRATWGRIAVGVALLAATAGAGLARWRPDPLPVRAVIRPEGWSWEAGFAHDGRSYLIQVRGGLLRFDAATGRQAGFIPLTGKLLPQGWIEDDDGRVASAVTDASDGARELLRVDAASGAVRARFAVPPGRSLCCPRPVDGGRAVAALLIGGKSPWEVVTWDLATGAAPRQALAEPPRPAGAGPWQRIGGTLDGRTWAYLDPTRGGVLLWDALAARPLGPILRDPADRPLAGTRATFAADGRTLALARPDGRVELWDVPEGRLLRVVAAHRGGLVPTLGVFSPDGRTLIALADDPGGSWRSWALDRYNRLAPGRWTSLHHHEAVVIAVATGAILARWPGVMYPPQFSPDGRTLAVQEPDGTISLRDIPPGP